MSNMNERAALCIWGYAPAFVEFVEGEFVDMRLSEKPDTVPFDPCNNIAHAWLLVEKCRKGYDAINNMDRLATKFLGMYDCLEDDGYVTLYNFLSSVDAAAITAACVEALEAAQEADNKDNQE